MTVGVYGLVAVIVRLDNVGMSLLAKESAVAKGIGNGLLVFAPLLMKFLAFAGTVAMFLVGGHILAHNTPPIHHFTEELVKQGGAIASIAPTLIDATTGVVAGGILVAILTVINKLRGKEAAH
jgi:predicted DNA repair protein MutK